ncbi:MAG: coiled-coil domain-containing protein [Candidatus Hodarchaeota archaeon]
MPDHNNYDNSFDDDNFDEDDDFEEKKESIELSTPEDEAPIELENDTDIISQLLAGSKPSSEPEPPLPDIIDTPSALQYEVEEADDDIVIVDAKENKKIVKEKISNQLQQLDNEIATMLSGLTESTRATSILGKLNELNAQKEIMEKAKITINPEDKNMANVISRDVPFPKSYIRYSMIPIDVDENYYSEEAYLNTDPLQFLNKLQNIAKKRSKMIEIFSQAQKENITVGDKATVKEIDKDRQRAVDIHYAIVSAAIHLHIYLQNLYDQYGHTMFIKAKQRIQDLMYPYEGHDPAYNLIAEKRKLTELKSFFGIFAELTEFLESEEWADFKSTIDVAISKLEADEEEEEKALVKKIKGEEGPEPVELVEEEINVPSMSVEEAEPVQMAPKEVIPSPGKPGLAGVSVSGGFGSLNMGTQFHPYGRRPIRRPPVPAKHMKGPQFGPRVGARITPQFQERMRKASAQAKAQAKVRARMKKMPLPWGIVKKGGVKLPNLPWFTQRFGRAPRGEELKNTVVAEYVVNKIQRGAKSLYTVSALAGLTPYTSNPSPTRTVFRVECLKDTEKVLGLFKNARRALMKRRERIKKRIGAKPAFPKGPIAKMVENLPYTKAVKKKREEIEGIKDKAVEMEKKAQVEASKAASLSQQNAELKDQITELERELDETEQRVRAEVLSELTASRTEILDLGEVNIDDFINHDVVIPKLQEIILKYIKEGLENIKHAELLGRDIEYDVGKNVFYDLSTDIKTDIVSKMAEIREDVEQYLSMFYTSDKLLQPMFFLKFIYRHDTFLGKTGVGNIIHTFTLGPLEKQEIRVKTSETTREAREASSTIFDSASQSAQAEMEESLSQERESSKSTSVDTAKYSSSSVSAGVSASVGFGPVSVGASLSASSSKGSSKQTNSTHNQSAKNTQNASQKHVASRQSQRDTTVNEMSQSEKETTKEQGYIRLIENPNPDVAMNYTFRQIVQEYISTISLIDIKLMFSNGVTVREAPASEVDNLLETFLKPELKSVHQVLREFIIDACRVRDYQDRLINMLESEEGEEILRLRKDSYAKILEDPNVEFDPLSEAQIFDLFKNIYGPLIHYWKFSIIQPGAVMIPEISYGSSLGPQARQEFQMKLENWKNENATIALQNESIQVKNQLIREFLKILPDIKDEQLKVDAIFKLVNQSTEIADKLTILRLMNEGGASISNLRKNLKLTP